MLDVIMTIIYTTSNLMPFVLCVVCVVGLIWINTISNPGALIDQMDY